MEATYSTDSSSGCSSCSWLSMVLSPAMGKEAKAGDSGLSWISLSIESLIFCEFPPEMGRFPALLSEEDSRGLMLEAT